MEHNDIYKLNSTIYEWNMRCTSTINAPNSPLPTQTHTLKTPRFLVVSNQLVKNNVHLSMVGTSFWQG
uniref:Uncharacterized protein n=1 Tax=Rhizophora mucronata TaxID=61149 RepID=A0A2P2KKJ7_RHIMU